jgi:hypothetical protein
MEMGIHVLKNLLLPMQVALSNGNIPQKLEDTVGVLQHSLCHCLIQEMVLTNQVIVVRLKKKEDYDKAKCMQKNVLLPAKYGKIFTETSNKAISRPNKRKLFVPVIPSR